VEFGGPHAPPPPRDQFGSLMFTPRATNGIDVGDYVPRDHSGRFATIMVAPFDKRKSGVALRRTSALASNTWLIGVGYGVLVGRSQATLSREETGILNFLMKRLSRRRSIPSKVAACARR